MEKIVLFQLQNAGYLAGDAKILNNINFRCVLANLSHYRSFWFGKEYAAKIVASLISPTSGTLLLEGEDVSTTKARNLPPASLLLCPDADAVWRYGR